MWNHFHHPTFTLFFNSPTYASPPSTSTVNLRLAPSTRICFQIWNHLHRPTCTILLNLLLHGRPPRSTIKLHLKINLTPFLLNSDPWVFPSLLPLCCSYLLLMAFSSDADFVNSLVDALQPSLAVSPFYLQLGLDIWIMGVNSRIRRTDHGCWVK